MIEETADQTTVTEAEEQAKEPQTEQKTEQRKLTPESPPQRDEHMSTTTPEEVDLTICDCIRCINLLYSYSRVIVNQFKVIRLARLFQVVIFQTIALLKVHSCYYYSHRILER